MLQDQYFNVQGESGYTRPFEARIGPPQCYRCQQMGHKTFSCQNEQVCAKCARVGHYHSDWAEEVPRCALCRGPHESFSKNCRVLNLTRHE